MIDLCCFERKKTRTEKEEKPENIHSQENIEGFRKGDYGKL